METRLADRIEDSQSGEAPIDAAIPDSPANPQGDSYRDFSADRREYRAQMRHRAAEHLRLVELRAQAEAEAAVAEVEAAHAEADAATLRPDASRSSQEIATQAIREEQAVEHQRRSSSSREPAQQAARGAVERLEAARRAEAAALVDSIARREEREIAEAQASALRRQAQYTEPEPPGRQLTPQSNRAVPEKISDSYSPPLPAEGGYFETPATPVAETCADRSHWFALRERFLLTENGRLQDTQPAADTNRKTPIIAFFSMAGGVGKTTLVATLGRTLSSLGEKVLLVDVTSHGLLPFYFGASEPVTGTVRTFVPPSGSTDSPVRLVSYITDLHNAKKTRDEIVEDLLANSQSAHRVLIDMDVNCRWLVECVAPLQPTVLVPLYADMNSIVSLQSVERSFASIQDAEGKHGARFMC